MGDLVGVVGGDGVVVLTAGVVIVGVDCWTTGVSSFFVSALLLLFDTSSFSFES